MTWFALVTATIFACEIGIRLPFLQTVRELKRNFEKARLTLVSRSVSDHWKERVLPVYGLRVVFLSAKGFILIIGSLAPFVLAWLASFQHRSEFLHLLMAPEGIMAVTLIAWFYLFLRHRLSNNRAKI